VKDPYLRLTPRQASVRRYFTPTPNFPNIKGPVILAAIVVLVIIMAQALPITIAGLAIIGYAAKKAVPRVLRYNELRARAEPKPSDPQMDQWLTEAFQPAIDQGFKRLDLGPENLIDPSRPPLLVVGFPRNPGPAHRLARGRDGHVRSNYYDILVVYMTDWHLSTFQCMLEMETGDFISDQTREFHYRDVLSVATSSDRLVIQLPIDHSRPQRAGDGDGKTPANESLKVEATTSQMFRLRVASDEIQVLVRLFDFAINGEDRDIDLALRQIRGRLRDYTKLHEPDKGAFDDLHQARQRSGRAWPGGN
jgi:hypothetical protein